MASHFRRICAGCIVFVACASVASAGAVKIAPIIEVHRAEKVRPPGRSPKAHARRLLDAGLSPGNPAYESCVLYVEEELSLADLDRLEAAGIRFADRKWVAPVKGLHPLGFYRAQVPYSQFGLLQADPRIVRVDSTEFAAAPHNNRARNLMGIEAVQQLLTVSTGTGSGVKVAIADSGIDLSHPDLPPPVETFDVTDGSDVGSWSTDVGNTLIDHGTHVTGSVVASGSMSEGNIGNDGGVYAGAAPGALLYFYKIGNDVNANTTFDDMIEAIQRAQEVGCDIFSMSYGGWGSTFLDGSSPVCQAIDAARAQGMTIFMSAGNDADKRKHDSQVIPSGVAVPSISFTVTNTGGSVYFAPQQIRLIWRDADPFDGNLTLGTADLQGSESLVEVEYDTSARGTETRLYALNPEVPAGESRTYQFQLSNVAPGTAPTVHLFRMAGRGQFDSPDPSHTIGHPALCDGATAVGSWTQRTTWEAADGRVLTNTYMTEGQISPFSSRGPRVDGRRKPELLAPGAMVISTRDSTFANQGSLIIDNDGIGLDGSGPANYYLLSGTSQATPLAAGAAAVLLEAAPGLGPVGVFNGLSTTASSAAEPDDVGGHGLIDVAAAVASVPAPDSDMDGDWYPANGGTAVDCDDANPDVWARPGEVTQLVFVDRRSLTWAEPSEPGSRTVPYDLLRSSTPETFDSAVCLENADAADRVAYDETAPGSGQVFHYLVRGRNVCPDGTGSLGMNSSGVVRTGPTCP